MYHEITQLYGEASQLGTPSNSRVGYDLAGRYIRPLGMYNFGGICPRGIGSLKPLLLSNGLCFIAFHVPVPVLSSQMYVNAPFSLYGYD